MPSIYVVGTIDPAVLKSALARISLAGAIVPLPQAGIESHTIWSNPQKGDQVIFASAGLVPIGQTLGRSSPITWYLNTNGTLVKFKVIRVVRDGRW